MKNYILFAILIFLPLLINAACQPIKLYKGEMKQTFSTYYDQEEKHSSVLEVDTSLFKFTKLIFNKVSNFDTLFVKFYSSDPCSAAVNPISEYHTLNQEIVINYQKQYRFIKVISSGKITSTFSINTLVLQEMDKCNKFSNAFNSFDNPIMYNNLNSGDNFSNLCNKNCSGLSLNNSLINQNVNDPIIWVQYPVTNQTILNISWDNPDFSLLLYGVKNGRTFFIRDLFFENAWDAEPFYLQFSEFDAIKIGAYSLPSKAGGFKLNLKKLPIKNSCVHYFDNGHRLEVIHTSKNSPKEGPYLFGEEVTYEYKLLDWLPINHNWFHGVKVNFGAGWKGFKKNNDHNLLVKLQDKTVPHDSLIYNNQLDYVKSDSLRYIGFNVKSLMLPGFYFKNADRGPSGPTSNYRWGKEFKAVRSTVENPLFRLKFTLVADSLKECTPLDGFVNILPLSDFQTGMYDISGCVETIPIVRPALIKCCESTYANSFKDTTMCSGEEFVFTNLAGSEAEYQIVNTPNYEFYSFEKMPLYNNLKLINESNVIDTLLIKVTWGEGTNCTDIKNFKILVKPMNNINDLSFDRICKNQKVNLSNALKTNTDTTAFVKNLSSLDIDAYKDEKGLTWIGSDTKKELSLTISSSVFCDHNVQLRYNPESCDASELENDNIVVNVQPNPTYLTTDLIIKNDTESSEWSLNVYDERGLLIKSSAEYLPNGAVVILHHDLSAYAPGVYHFKLSDQKTTISRNVIKLKN